MSVNLKAVTAFLHEQAEGDVDIDGRPKKLRALDLRPAQDEANVIKVDYEGLSYFVNRFSENKDVFERLKYLCVDLARHETHFIVLSGQTKIIAAGSVCPNPYDSSELWLTHISVDPDHRCQGHGSRILAAIFDFTDKAGYILAPSTFEDDGFKYLAPVMARLHHQHPDLKIRYGIMIGEEITGVENYSLIRPNGYGSLKVQKLPAQKL